MPSNSSFPGESISYVQIWISFSQGPPLPSLIPSFAVDYNVKKANGERTDDGCKKMPRWAWTNAGYESSKLV